MLGILHNSSRKRGRSLTKLQIPWVVGIFLCWHNQKAASKVLNKDIWIMWASCFDVSLPLIHVLYVLYLGWKEYVSWPLVWKCSDGKSTAKFLILVSISHNGWTPISYHSCTRVNSLNQCRFSESSPLYIILTGIMLPIMLINRILANEMPQGRILRVRQR